MNSLIIFFYSLKAVVLECGDAIRNDYDNVLDNRDTVIVHLEVYPIDDGTAITSQVREHQIYNS